MSGCFYTCMDGCDVQKYGKDVCRRECNNSCVEGPEAYKKPTYSSSINLYGAPSIQEALRESGPAFITKHSRG